MKSSTNRALWIGGTAVGAAAVVGAILAFTSKSANAAPSPSNNLLAVITDPATVTQYQTILASAIASGTKLIGPGGVPVTSVNYATPDIDGNTSNPRWVSVLSITQAFWNNNYSSQDWASMPPGFPTELRTDGVLDYATALVLARVAAEGS